MAPWRFGRRRAQPYAAVSDEERMSRYVYLLGTLPVSVIERAHEAAFKELPLQKRLEMFDRLRPFMSDAEREEAAEPALLARVLRRVSARGSGDTTVLERETASARAEDAGPPGSPADGRRQLWPFDDPVLSGIVAYHFLSSYVVATYFTVGAGSLALGGEPAWVGELGSPGTAGDMPVDGMGGYDSGGGYDGGYDGGFGGFDGGGFG